MAYAGRADPSSVRQARRRGGGRRAELGPELRRLLASDVDRQWANPLDLVRRAVSHTRPRCWPPPGCPPWCGTSTTRAHFPDDVYGLTPRTFADLDPSLREVRPGVGGGQGPASMVRHR